jgi:hypothetical protein
MDVRIEVQGVPVTPESDANGAANLPLLPGAVEGVTAGYRAQPRGVERVLVPDPGTAYVVLFFSGDGEVQLGEWRASWAGVAALAGTASATFRATSAQLEYLELLLERSSEEIERARMFFFARYADCETYGESIKSATTVSRTIVPPDVVPRFCMGSVEAMGPDEVGAHAHPILEQLFWGLPGNECLVAANEARAVFGERMLLHVPLGSRHGVSVPAGKRLHYVWMDFFRSEADLAYIQQEHRPAARQTAGGE